MWVQEQTKPQPDLGNSNLSPWDEQQLKGNDQNKMKCFIKQHQLYITKSEQTFRKQENTNRKENKKFLDLYEKSKKSFKKCNKNGGNGEKNSNQTNRLIYDFGEKASTQLHKFKKEITTNDIIYNVDNLDIDDNAIIRSRLTNFLPESDLLWNKLKRPNTASKKNADKFFGNMSRKRVESACPQKNYESNKNFNKTDFQELAVEASKKNQKNTNLGKKTSQNSSEYRKMIEKTASMKNYEPFKKYNTLVNGVGLTNNTKQKIKIQLSTNRYLTIGSEKNKNKQKIIGGEVNNFGLFNSIKRKKQLISYKSMKKMNSRTNVGPLIQTSNSSKMFHLGGGEQFSIGFNKQGK